MRTTKAYFIIICISMTLYKFGYSQSDNTAEMTVSVSIPAIALIDFEGNDHLITFNSPNQIEQIITPSTLNTTWLNYSSIIEHGSTNYITVHISSGILPNESLINLQIGQDQGEGSGKTGIPSSDIRLSYYPQNIITDIGSCFTGRGIKKGHLLTYQWENIDDYSESLYSKDEYTITVTYTISSTD